jgi:hypothetical protein
MATNNQIFRGLEIDIPTLSIGQMGYTTDSYKLFIGSAVGNKEITNQAIPNYAGLAANLPTLAVGQFGYTTDTTRLYIGTASGNVEIPTAATSTYTVTQLVIGNGLAINLSAILDGTTDVYDALSIELSWTQDDYVGPGDSYNMYIQYDTKIIKNLATTRVFDYQEATTNQAAIYGALVLPYRVSDGPEFTNIIAEGNIVLYRNSSAPDQIIGIVTKTIVDVDYWVGTLDGWHPLVILSGIMY